MKFNDWNVGISEAEISGGAILYPNPILQEININFEKTLQTGLIKIHDVYGKLIQSEQINNLSSIQIPFMEGDGIYFVSIESNDLIKTFKVIKN
jgi:hypothetical protein